MKKTICLTLFALSAFAANPGGGSTECANRSISGPIPNNLHVPAGTTCTLSWATVAGNVSVDGTLLSISSKFEANVTVSGTVSFINNYQTPLIGKNLTVTNSASGQSGIFGDTTLIKGNVTISGLQPGASFTFSSDTTVNGGVSITNNLGPVNVSYLSIGQSLDCSGNNPAPNSWSIDHGYGSTTSATGGKTGQCAAL
jgi:hypothetical protein